MSKKQYKSWRTTELKQVQNNLHITDEQLSKMIGRSICSIRTARKRYGITKKINHGRFKIGNPSWNKGTSFHAGGKSIETQFKVGHKPHNKFRKIGDVFVIPDKNKNYKFIKLKNNRQYPYGRYVWQKVTGEKLTNEIIRFKNGDPSDCEFSNLIKLTRSENIKLNTNRKKAANSLKKSWMIAKTFKDFGYIGRNKLVRRTCP